MKVIDYIKYLRDEIHCIPTTLRRGLGKEVYGVPSNQVLKQWLNNGSITINGKPPKPFDVIEFPVWELVFFPKSKRRVTLVKDA